LLPFEIAFIHFNYRNPEQNIEMYCRTFFDNLEMPQGRKVKMGQSYNRVMKGFINNSTMNFMMLYKEDLNA